MNGIAKARAVAARVLGRGPARAVPAVAANTYSEPGNQWYRPVVGGALTLAPYITGGRVVREARDILDRVSPDVYVTYVQNFYDAGLAKYGENWQYADINTALLGLGAVLKPEHYLEIGVRRGRSLAMLASRVPNCHIVACDLFIKDYAEMENPGPEFVRQELTRMGFTGKLDFVIGDSASVLPQYFDEHPDAFFDLITVDGDHTETGARIDLVNVMSRIKVGGALVFDDVSNHSHPELLQVWRDVIVAHPRFSSYTFTDIGFGVAIAVRTH